MANAQIITQVILNEGEVLTKKKVVLRQPNYYKVGNGTMNKHGIQSIDIIDILMDCSRAGQQVFRWIKKGIAWDPYEKRMNYISIIRRKDLTKAQEKMFDRGISELLKLDLVRRLKPSHYIINPNALIPPDYVLWLKVWKKAGGEAMASDDVDAYLMEL